MLSTLLARSDRRAPRVAAGLLILACAWGGLVVPAAAQVVVRVVDQSLSFAQDTTVTVEIALENADAVAGLDLLLDYPSDLLAVDFPNPSTTNDDGDLFSSVTVNHDDQRVSLPAGTRRIAAAAASATALGVAGGVFVRIDFPVRCQGYAQDYPAGRDVVLRLAQARAFDVTGAALAVQTVDGTLSLDCTALAVDDPASFGTLKSLFGDADGGR